MNLPVIQDVFLMIPYFAYGVKNSLLSFVAKSKQRFHFFLNRQPTNTANQHFPYNFHLCEISRENFCMKNQTNTWDEFQPMSFFLGDTTYPNPQRRSTFFFLKGMNTPRGFWAKYRGKQLFVILHTFRCAYPSEKGFKNASCKDWWLWAWVSPRTVICWNEFLLHFSIY